ncbi:MAG: 50S ribosomal protein L25/general stress protein Ctc [Gammaproteobacteria bacterium]|jgi:large subunit ribosomal protein L25
MATDFVLNAELREDKGKGASRRLRRTGRVPGILYGGDQEPLSISLDHNELMNNLKHEAFYSHILTLKIGKKKEQAILKDLQRHVYKSTVVQHADFLRVSADREIHVHVPLHFLGEKEAVGVKQQGGVISHHMIEVEITCLPANLPEYIEVDVSALELGQAIHLSELKLPEGVKVIELTHGEEHDLPVISIHHARVSAVEEEAAEGEEAEAAEARPAEAAKPAEGGEAGEGESEDKE